MAKYLIDTCIWRDFYENRFSKSNKPIGKYASDLFMKILKNNDGILFSISLIWELKKDYVEEEINNMLNFLFMNNILIRLDITNEEYKEARKISDKKNIPFVDCLNAIHARNHKAIMISRDVHFIKDLSHVVKTVKPENIN